MRTEHLSTTAVYGTLLGSHTSSTGSLLRTHLSVGAVDVVTGFGGGGSLAGVVTFVDDCEMEEIAAEGEVEMVDVPSFERSRFQRGKSVDCDGNGCDCGGQ
jgi:hypothetical protein